MWTEGKYADNKQLKCYIECMYSTLNFIDNDGEFVKDKMVESVEKVTTEMIDVCNDKAKNIEERCEKVYQFDACMLKYFES